MLTVCVCLFVYLEHTQYWDCVLRVTGQSGRVDRMCLFVCLFRTYTILGLCSTSNRSERPC